MGSGGRYSTCRKYICLAKFMIWTECHLCVIESQASTFKTFIISLSMHSRRGFPMNHARWLDWKVGLYNIYVAAGFSSEKAIPVSHWKILIRNAHAKAYQTKHLGHKRVQNKHTSEQRSQCDSSRFVAGTGQFCYFSSILLTPAYYIHI